MRYFYNSREHLNYKRVSGKECVRLEFAGENVPYFAKGRAYIRVADEDKQMSAKELEKYILEKNKNKIRWDTEICKDAVYDDIDENKLSNYLTASFSSPW